MSARLLVVGARPNSLGAAVTAEAEGRGFHVTTAGISGEQIPMDVVNAPGDTIREILSGYDPTFIVCTVGLNMARTKFTGDISDWWRWHFETNVTGPMRLLEAWEAEMMAASYIADPLRHFVAVSSNSARIPRTDSAAYCASKAALSMALRVAGREVHGGDSGWCVYGSEPGLLAGTPMTEDARASFSGPLTRMRGARVADGIPVHWLARAIVDNFIQPERGYALNGTMIPFDGNEL